MEVRALIWVLITVLSGQVVFARLEPRRPYIFYSAEGKRDKSFGQAAYSGVKRFIADYAKLKAFYGFKTPLFMRGLEGSNLSYNLSVATRQVQEVIASGYNVIIALGYMGPRVFNRLARKHPGVVFVAIDVPVAHSLRNALAFVFEEREGAYIAGYLSAFISKTGKIAAIGGMPMRPVKRYICGYKRGVEAAGDVLKKRGKKISFIGPVYMGNTSAAFTDVSRARMLASDLYGSGVDVIFAVASLASTGVLQASGELSTPAHPLYSVGVDSNQNAAVPGHVLTSVIKRIEIPVYASLLLSTLGKLSLLGGKTIALGAKGLSLRRVLGRQPGFAQKYLQRAAVDVTYDRNNRKLVGPKRYREVIVQLRKNLKNSRITVQPCFL